MTDRVVGPAATSGRMGRSIDAEKSSGVNIAHQLIVSCRPRSTQVRETALAAGLSAGLTLAFLALPLELAAALSVVCLVAMLLLVDTWVTLLLLLLLRSSLDVFVDTKLAGDWNVAALLTLLLIAAGLIHVITRRVSIAAIPLAGPFLALLAVSAVSVPYALDPVVAFEDWLRTLGVFLLYVFMVDRLRSDGLRAALVSVVILSAVVPVSVGVYQLVTDSGDHFTPGYNRVFATFAHPSPFAFYLLTVLPAAVAFLMYSRRGWPKLGVAALSAVLALCVVVTFTRDAWAGMIVTLLVIAIGRKPGLFLPILLVVMLVYVAAPGIQGRLSDVGSQSSSFAWRVDQWQEAVSLMAPWQLPAGMGSGSVNILTGNAAHNDYIRAFAEAGVLGSVAFLWLYAGLLRRSLETYRSVTSAFQRDLALGCTALVTARLIMSFTDNLFVHPVVEWYFWSLAGLMVSLLSHPGAAVSPPSSSGEETAAQRTARRRSTTAGV